MSAKRRQVARGVRELAVELFRRISDTWESLSGNPEDRVTEADSLTNDRTRAAWLEMAAKLRKQVRRHDALQRAPVPVFWTHAPSALAAILVVADRVAELMGAERWHDALSLEWGIEETELLARLDQELAALSVGRKAKPKERQREESLDKLAMGAVSMFENPDDPKYRPNWTVADVARELGVPHSALVGRQRDGRPRCPDFTTHRRRNRRAPVTRRKRDV